MMKLAKMLTGVWTLLVIAASGVVLFYVSKAPAHEQDALAYKAGNGIGMVATIGYMAIWIPRMMASLKRRRQRLEEEKCRKEASDEERPRKRKR